MSHSEISVEEPLSLSVDKSIRLENAADHSVFTDSIESQPEQQQRRARTLTEKGQAYQECRREQNEKEEDRLIKKFNEVYESWKRQVTQIETFLASEPSPSQTEKDEKISNL